MLEGIPAERRLWEWRHLNSRLSLDTEVIYRDENKRRITALAVDQAGRWLAVSREGAAVVLDPENNNEPIYLPACSSGGSALPAWPIVSPDGRMVGDVAGDVGRRSIRIWLMSHLAEGRPPLFDWPTQLNSIATFHPQRRILASADGNGCIRLWDLEHVADAA